MTTILIVDDAEFLRVRIAKILTAQGFTVLQADNGLNAVTSYKISHPDAVVMDITMPEMDGLTALREIKAYDARAKVLMLTALGQESVVMEALKSGALDFIVKPFDAHRVVSAVQRALAGNHPATNQPTNINAAPTVATVVNAAV